jgi:hypothetical protein
MDVLDSLAVTAIGVACAATKHQASNVYDEVQLQGLQLSINIERQRCEALENEVRKLTAANNNLVMRMGTPQNKHGGKNKYATMRPSGTRGKEHLTDSVEVFRRMLDPALHNESPPRHPLHALPAAVPAVASLSDSDTPPRRSSDGGPTLVKEASSLSSSSTGGGMDVDGQRGKQGLRRSADLSHLATLGLTLSTHGVDSALSSAQSTPTADSAPVRHPTVLDVDSCAHISIPATLPLVVPKPELPPSVLRSSAAIPTTISSHVAAAAILPLSSTSQRNAGPPTVSGGDQSVLADTLAIGNITALTSDTFSDSGSSDGHHDSAFSSPRHPGDTSRPGMSYRPHNCSTPQHAPGDVCVLLQPCPTCRLGVAAKPASPADACARGAIAPPWTTVPRR